MKKILLSTAVLLAASSAFANTPSFTGAYLGGIAGYTTGTITDEKGKEIQTDKANKIKGFLWGANAGYGYQLPSNNMYVGLDLSFLFGGKNKHSSEHPMAGKIELEWKQKFAGAVMGQVGYVAGSFMPYLEAGLQVSKLELTVSARGQTYKDAKTKPAFAFGAGVKFKTGPVVLSASYRYSNTCFEPIINGQKLATKISQNRFMLGAAYAF